VRSPEAHGIGERSQGTITKDFFSAVFREMLCESVEPLRTDFDKYLDFYNWERSHQGYRTKGRTPCQAFLEGVNGMLPERVA